MNSKTHLQYVAVCMGALLVAASPAARAQTILPVLPATRGPVPAEYVNCTAETLNVSGFVSSDGRISIYNVPTTQSQIRVTVTCKDASGKTVTGQSELLTPTAGVPLSVGSLTFGSNTSIPTMLAMSPGSAR